VSCEGRARAQPQGRHVQVAQGGGRGGRAELNAVDLRICSCCTQQMLMRKLSGQGHALSLTDDLCRSAKAEDAADVAVSVEANGASAKPHAPAKAPEAAAPAPEPEEAVEIMDPAEARSAAAFHGTYTHGLGDGSQCARKPSIVSSSEQT